MSSSLYKQNIIDHYKYPHNAGSIENADIKFKATNASCGDEIELFLKFDQAGEGGKVVEVKHNSRGCAISVATMSMLSDKLIGLTRTELKSITQLEVLSLTGLTETSGRAKCALVSHEALIKGLAISTISK